MCQLTCVKLPLVRPVAYAEHFHGGGHSVAYDGHLYLICAVFDVTIWRYIMFPNQRFGEVCWHNIRHTIRPVLAGTVPVERLCPGVPVSQPKSPVWHSVSQYE